MSDRYEPEYPAGINTPEQISEYLYRELQKIGDAIEAVHLGHLHKTNVEPEKPRDGDFRYADGVNWSPPRGIGRGFYRYDAILGYWVPYA